MEFDSEQRRSSTPLFEVPVPLSNQEETSPAVKTVDITPDFIFDKGTKIVGIKSRRKTYFSDPKCSVEESPAIPVKRPKGKETPSPPLYPEPDNVYIRRPSKSLHFDAIPSARSQANIVNSTLPFATNNIQTPKGPLFYSVQSENNEDKQFAVSDHTDSTNNKNLSSIYTDHSHWSKHSQSDLKISCPHNPQFQVTFASISVKEKNEKKSTSVSRVSSTPSMCTMTSSKEENKKKTLSSSFCSHPLAGSFVFGDNKSSSVRDHHNIFRTKSESDRNIYNFGGDKNEHCRDDMNRVSFSQNLASTPAVELYKYKHSILNHSSRTPRNRTQTVPVTPSKPLLPMMLPSDSKSEESNKALHPTLATPHHCGKRSSYGIFSPSILNVSKPPSELFSFGNEKTYCDTICAKNNSDNKTEKTSSPPSTPFRFCSFPASLPRVHPRREKKSCDEICHLHKHHYDTMNENEKNGSLCHNYAIQGIDLFASSQTENYSNANTPQRPKNADSIIAEKKSFGLSNTLPLESSATNALQSRCHGRHRSADTSHDTSLSSISVGSPLSDARRLLSRESEEGTIVEHVREEGNWPDADIVQNDEFDLSSDTDSFSDKAKVSGTKLNFNTLSPVETENQTESTSTANEEKGSLKPTHSSDLTETYELNSAGPSSSVFHRSFPSSIEKESSQIVEMSTPSRLPKILPHDRLDQSSTTRHAEFQYQLESTLCSPIHPSDGSCSPMLLEKESTTPTQWSNENCILPSLIGPLHEKANDYRENESSFLTFQKNNSSCLSTSTSSSKIRKLRPMPDISAFEGAGSARRRSSAGAKNKSIASTSSSASSPLKFCPPTPVRTPAWAHNDSLTPAFGRQDSLISSKVLAACPPELLDDFSSFEHSLGDDLADASSCVNQTPKNMSHVKQSLLFQHSEKPVSRISNEIGKGQAGKVSLVSSSTFGYSCPSSSVKKQQLSTSISSRQDSTLNRSNGQVGSAISFEVDFDNLGQLGSGHFADVYKAQSKTDNSCYAIKRNRRQFRGKRDREHALAEVRTMQRLQSGSKRSNDEKNKGFCPYLLLFIRAWQEDGYFYCQTELCCRDNCQNLIMSVSTEWHSASKKYPSLLRNLPPSMQEGEETSGRLLPEPTIWKICHDIISGLFHIHSHNMVHNDIKPSNIFFVAHNRLGCICKIGDFGLAGDVGSIEDGQEGDNKYMPQELLSSSVKDPSADIFSMGLTMYELATDSSFDLPTEGPKWHAIRSGKKLDEMPRIRSKNLNGLIQVMISPDPNKRPPADKILKEVPEIKEYGNVYEKFLADYVKDVVEADLERERELLAMQKEANLRRSTPTGGSLLNIDRSWHVRTPTTDNNMSSFLPVQTNR